MATIVGVVQLIARAMGRTAEAIQCRRSVAAASARCNDVKP